MWGNAMSARRLVPTFALVVLVSGCEEVRHLRFGPLGGGSGAVDAGAENIALDASVVIQRPDLSEEEMSEVEAPVLDASTHADAALSRDAMAASPVLTDARVDARAADTDDAVEERF
jgi:hypothetical protein